MKKLTLLALLFVAAVLFSDQTAAQPAVKIDEKPTRTTASRQFLNDYADRLEAKLKDKSVGYSFTVIADKGLTVSRAGGDARRAPDANPRKMTPDDKFNIASVSKTITAAAVVKLLHEKKISADAPVYSYLPADWTLGENFKTITFRELLTHRAGIRCSGKVTYSDLKQCVAAGIKLEDKPTQKYDNTNFSLFRMIIPHLAAYPGLNLPGKSDDEYSKIYADYYKVYVQKNIFASLGLKGIDLKPIAANPALAYQYPEPIIAGDSFGDMTETGASRGWNMSARQIAVFFYGLMNTEKILPKFVSEQMKNDRLGLWKGTIAGELVDYGHGGFYPGKNAKGELYNQGEMHTLGLWFSNGVVVGLIINSQFGPKQSISAAARDAMKEMTQ